MKRLNFVRCGAKSTLETGNDKHPVSENLPELEFEFDKSYKNHCVDVGLLISVIYCNSIKKIIRHSQNCTIRRMDLTKEVRSGLISKLWFRCYAYDVRMLAEEEFFCATMDVWQNTCRNVIEMEIMYLEREQTLDLHIEPIIISTNDDSPSERDDEYYNDSD
ncbi:hypothetical protein FQA39_LY17048 [Lamprigera yunnana]|nr:hypothetical protein FQA39_LY17048 [Lamprigera yunnana]